MDYQKHYEQLITKHGSQDKPEGYSERHHVLPKSMGGSNDASNLVYLSAKAHFVAHHLLWRWHRNAPMAHAFHCMSDMGSDERYRPSSVVYAEARAAMAKEVSLRMSGRVVSNVTKARLSSSSVGKVMSDAARAKMSLAAKSRVVSDETKAKMAESMTGKTHSDETKAKMSTSAMGGRNSAKGFIIYCHATDEVIATGTCLKDWAIANGYSHKSLTRVARGERAHNKGVYARYI